MNAVNVDTTKRPRIPVGFVSRVQTRSIARLTPCLLRESPERYTVSDESRSVVAVVWRVIETTQDQRVTFLAASVAYYAFVSLIPAFLLLLVVASALFGDAFAARALEIGSEFLTPAGEETIESAIGGAAGRGGATVAGFAVLLWSTLKVVRALDTSFMQVYGVRKRVTFVDQLINAGSVVVAIGVGIVVMIGVGAALAAIDLRIVLQIAGIVALPALLTVVFFPMYFLLPYPPISPREAIPGAAFAAVSWTLLQTGFQLYAANAGQYQVYGVVGGILLLVTWLYVASMVVIVGAVVNVVLAEGRTPGYDTEPAASSRPSIDHADRQLQQAAGTGVRMGEDEQNGTGGGDEEVPRGAPDVAELGAEVTRLRSQLDEFEQNVERRTVDRPHLEAELKRYVRSRMRRGHARGWGPYLVLLYGVALTFGAFYYLSGVWAIAAMLVLFLSTLGLYAVFVVVGIALNALETPGKAIDYVRDRRE